MVLLLGRCLSPLAPPPEQSCLRKPCNGGRLPLFACRKFTLDRRFVFPGRKQQERKLQADLSQFSCDS